MYVCGSCVQWFTCRVQRTILWNKFSISTLWVLRIHFKQLHLAAGAEQSSQPKKDFLGCVCVCVCVKFNSEDILWGWRDGSAVKNTDCSSGGPEFNSSNHMVAHNHL
jgi:hypothetical protein